MECPVFLFTKVYHDFGGCRHAGILGMNPPICMRIIGGRSRLWGGIMSGELKILENKRGGWTRGRLLCIFTKYGILRKELSGLNSGPVVRWSLC